MLESGIAEFATADRQAAPVPASSKRVSERDSRASSRCEDVGSQAADTQRGFFVASLMHSSWLLRLALCTFRREHAEGRATSSDGVGSSHGRRPSPTITQPFASTEYPRRSRSAETCVQTASAPLSERWSFDVRIGLRVPLRMRADSNLDRTRSPTAVRCDCRSVRLDWCSRRSAACHRDGTRVLWWRRRGSPRSGA